MTGDVAALVLRNNYLQSQALSTLESQAVSRLPEYQHLIRQLERSGELIAASSSCRMTRHSMSVASCRRA